MEINYTISLVTVLDTDLTSIIGKNKTAIEIEESEVKYIWRDYVKLVMGYRKGYVVNAVLICPLSYHEQKMKTGVPIYSTAKKISEFMSDLLWMKNLVIIGYRKGDKK